MQQLNNLFRSVLGTFWTEVYGGVGDVRALTQATAEASTRIHDIVDRITPFLGVSGVEATDRRDWYSLIFAESDRRKSVEYGESLVFGENGVYGQDVFRRAVYPIPAGIVSIGQMMNRSDLPSAWFFQGQDYTVDPINHLIRFSHDPLMDERFQSTVIQNDVHIWGWNVEFEADYAYDYSGFISGYREKRSTKDYLEFTQKLLPLLVDGPTASRFDDAIVAATGYPLAKYEETVIDITYDHTSRLVITDRSVYRVPMSADVSVTVGQLLVPGSVICSSLIVHEFNRGTLPADCDFITVGPEHFGGKFKHGLTFRNTSLPTTVSEDDGKVRIRFQIDGLESEVEEFWSDVRTAEDRLGRTVLEYLLDQDDPAIGAAPAEINPAEFLAQYILRWGGVRLLCSVNPNRPWLGRRLTKAIDLGSAGARLVVTLAASAVSESNSTDMSELIGGGASPTTLTEETPTPSGNMLPVVPTELCV